MENNNINNDKEQKKNQQIIYRCAVRLFDIIQKSNNIQEGYEFKGRVTYLLSKNHRKHVKDAPNILKDLNIIDKENKYVDHTNEDQSKEIETIRLQSNSYRVKPKIENISEMIVKRNTKKIIFKIKNDFVEKGDKEFKKSDVQKICRCMNADLQGSFFFVVLFFNL